MLKARPQVELDSFLAPYAVEYTCFDGLVEHHVTHAILLGLHLMMYATIVSR